MAKVEVTVKIKINHKQKVSAKNCNIWRDEGLKLFHRLCPSTTDEALSWLICRPPWWKHSLVPWWQCSAKYSFPLEPHLLGPRSASPEYTCMQCLRGDIDQSCIILAQQKKKKKQQSICSIPKWCGFFRLDTDIPCITAPAPSLASKWLSNETLFLFFPHTHTHTHTQTQQATREYNVWFRSAQPKRSIDSPSISSRHAPFCKVKYEFILLVSPIADMNSSKCSLLSIFHVPVNFSLISSTIVSVIPPLLSQAVTVIFSSGCMSFPNWCVICCADGCVAPRFGKVHYLEGVEDRKLIIIPKFIRFPSVNDSSNTR